MYYLRSPIPILRPEMTPKAVVTMVATGNKQIDI